MSGVAQPKLALCAPEFGATAWETRPALWAQGGSRLATTIGGALTGLGGEWLILDDPHNATEAPSEARREAVISFVRESLLSRFDDPANGKIVLVMQRLHEADLAGQLIEAGGWELLKLPAIATEDIDIPVSRHRLHHVRAGDYLQPDHLTPGFLEDLRRQMGADRFEAQYQQDPLVPFASPLAQRVRAHPPPIFGIR
jgi:hypothetical protein